MHCQASGGETLANRMLKVGELARELGVSKMSIYRAVRSGQLPSYRLNRMLLIPASILEDIGHGGGTPATESAQEAEAE